MRISGTIELDGLYVTFNQGTSQQTTLQAGAPASNIILQLPTTADTLAGIAATQTLTNKTINAANNTISNLTVSMLAAGVLNTSTSLTGATDSQVPSALAAKTYADNVSVAGLATKADKTTTISAGTGLTGGGDLSANRTIALADTAVTLGSYGSATQVATFTVDQQGRLTAAGNTSIQIAESQVTNLVTDLAGKQAADVDLDALAALATTGLIARTGSGSAATRTITAPAAGITISNGDGVSGNPTLALADDLAALEGLSGTGIAVRTASNTWAQRSVAAGTGISVTNGDGVSGNPTVAIDSTVATLTGSQTLSNKTLDAPVIDNAATFVQETTPSNPSAGNYKLYPKSDGSFYVLNSSGVETQIGSGSSSGSGTLNIVDNPSAVSSTTGWTAATNYTVTRDTSNSPLAGVIDTCFAISTTTASSESSTSGVYAASQLMPAALRNTKQQVSIYANIPATSLGVWRLSVYNAAGTRMSLASDSSGVTTLPGGFNGQFVTTFDADSSASYTASLTQTTRTSANTLYVTNISIGNGITAQGAAISEWQSYTPTLTNGGTTSTNTGRWRRVGSSMEIQTYLVFTGAGSASAFSIGLPSGYTVDTTATPAGTNVPSNPVGHAQWSNGSIEQILQCYYINSTTPNGVRFIAQGASGAFLGNAFASGHEVGMKVMVPIAEWAGNGTVNLGQGAQVEYAATSGTWNADSSTTVYGPGGQLMGGALTAGRLKTITWQYPIQANDQIFVEGSRDGLTWAPLNGFAFSVGQVIPAVNSTALEASGVSYYNSSSTQTVIVFNRYVQIANDDAPVTDWPSSNAYWRVRKSTASAPVGFGLAGTDGSSGLYKPGQAPGLTTGVTIASGYVGETGRVALTASGNTSAAGTYVDSASFTLQAGEYEITVDAYCQITTTTTNTTPAVALALRTSTNTLVEQQAYTYFNIPTALSFNPTLTVRAVVNISTATTYKVSVQSNTASNYVIGVLADGAVLGGASGAMSSYVRWKRIA